MAEIKLQILEVHSAFEFKNSPQMRVNVRDSQSKITDAILDQETGLIWLSAPGHPDIIVPVNNVKWMKVLVLEDKPQKKIPFDQVIQPDDVAEKQREYELQKQLRRETEAREEQARQEKEKTKKKTKATKSKPVVKNDEGNIVPDVTGAPLPS